MYFSKKILLIFVDLSKWSKPRQRISHDPNCNSHVTECEMHFSHEQVPSGKKTGTTKVE